MRCPKLTPLQSRLAACLGTSLLLVIVYFSINPSHFAYAAELDSILNEDHNHHRIAFDLADWGEEQVVDLDHDAYESEFVGVSRSIIGRAALDTVSLTNNLPTTLNIDAGETQYYVLEKDQVFASPGSLGSQLPTNVTGVGAAFKKRSMIEGEFDEQEHDSILVKRQNATKSVYVSMNTCLQPNPGDGKTATPGQLTVWYSLDDNNQKPSATSNDGVLHLDQGYAGQMIPDVSGNVYLAVSAPALPPDTFTGPWSYQVAASGDSYYHYYNDTTAFLWEVDTDSTSALLATYNLTGQNDSAPGVEAERLAWMESQPPFTIKIFNNSSPLIDGIQKSYCGLSKLNMEFMQISSSITQRGIGANPKQQFHVQSLLPGQTYFSVLAYGGGNTTGTNAIIGGGGQVWKSMQFSTKSDGNCRIIFDLPFCTDVAYAVPYNPSNDSLSNLTTLSNIYDNNAQNLYKNFSRSLQQIPCNTSSTAQYSLTSNCTDCARDYKIWLCAVTIPRCVDFSTPKTDAYSFLATRNIGQDFTNGSTPDLAALGYLPAESQELLTNSSRNPLIDTAIKPGPYKELLPCQELCWDLVQSCPTAMGFACPRPGAQYGDLKKSYATFDSSKILGSDGVLNISQLSCNFLGVDWPTLGSGAGSMQVERAVWGVTVLVMAWATVGW